MQELTERLIKSTTKLAVASAHEALQLDFTIQELKVIVHTLRKIIDTLDDLLTSLTE